jgi:hypothetical protein
VSTCFSGGRCALYGCTGRGRKAASLALALTRWPSLFDSRTPAHGGGQVGISVDVPRSALEDLWSADGQHWFYLTVLGPSSRQMCCKAGHGRRLRVWPPAGGYSSMMVPACFSARDGKGALGRNNP